ncbi:MAG: carbohydrate ABC transporter substrate-binding protein [Ruminococcus sp.]|nr:carbohydrate ABC transporter substrate-binding protein [Ruminococcus sp.]
MKNLKKTLALLAALAMSATALYGCGDEKESSTANNSSSKVEESKDDSKADDSSKEDNDGDAEGDQLTILCWNANDSKPMVDLFCEKTGHDPSEINIKNFDCQGGEAAELYEQYLSEAANDADIMFLEADWALKFINDDSQTMALSEIGIDESSLGDIYDYVLEIGKSTVDGTLKGISWQAAAGGYCYREDLAKEYLGVETPEQMQEKVKDWDTFLETAKEYKAAKGDKAAMAATLGGVWQVYGGSRGSAWLTSDNKLAVDDYCKNYAEFAKTLWSEGYVTNVNQWGDEWYALGATDDVLGYFVSTWGFGDTILAKAAGGEGGATFGKWKCVVGPAEFYWGGTWLAPATRCNSKDLAKEFIEFFTTNKDGAEAYALKQGEYMSNSAVMEKIIADGEYKGAPVLGDQNHFEVLNEVAKGIDMAGKITPYDSTIKTAFNDAVNAYCEGTLGSVEETMGDFETRVMEALPTQLNWE